MIPSIDSCGTYLEDPILFECFDALIYRVNDFGVCWIETIDFDGFWRVAADDQQALHKTGSL